MKTKNNFLKSGEFETLENFSPSNTFEEDNNYDI